MAHEVRTRPLPPTPGTAGAAAAPTFMDRVDRALEGLWHFLSSMRFALVLILALAALGVVGALRDPGAARHRRGPAGEGRLAQRDPAPLRRLDGRPGHARAVQHLQHPHLPGPDGRADDQPDRLLDPPVPGHAQDGDEAPRGRRRLVLRARAAARGHRRPAHAGRDPRAPRGRPQEQALPDADHRRRRHPPLRATAGAGRRSRASSATSRWSSSSPARSSAAPSGSATRSSRSPRAPRSRSRPRPA